MTGLPARITNLRAAFDQPRPARQSQKVGGARRFCVSTPTLVPLALRAMAVFRAAGLAVERPFTGAVSAAGLAAVLAGRDLMGWFRILRR